MSRILPPGDEEDIDDLMEASVARPRYMGTANHPGYSDHFMAQMRAERRFGNPMPPDEWMRLTDVQAHSLFTHTQYLRHHAELGYHLSNEGMVLSVWERCKPEMQSNMAEQMRQAVRNHLKAQAELPEGWGSW